MILAEPQELAAAAREAPKYRDVHFRGDEVRAVKIDEPKYTAKDGTHGVTLYEKIVDNAPKEVDYVAVVVYGIPYKLEVTEHLLKEKRKKNNFDSRPKKYPDNTDRDYFRLYNFEVNEEIE